MDEDFDFHICGIGDGFDFPKRQLAGQYHPLKSAVPQEFHAGQIGYRHLGGRVQRDVRRDFPGYGYHAEILHQKPVDGDGAQETEIPCQILHFLIADQSIQRHVHAGSLRMGQAHCFLHFFIRKIARKLARAEKLSAQIHRISAGIQRRYQVGRRTCRSQ